MTQAITPERATEIRTVMDGLYRLDKPALNRRVRQSYRVCDLNGVGKDSLVSMILQAKFGERTMTAWNAAR
jgi:hypothetical protein